MFITIVLLAGTVRLCQIIESNHLQVIFVHLLPRSSVGGVQSCNHPADFFVRIHIVAGQRPPPLWWSQVDGLLASISDTINMMDSFDCRFKPVRTGSRHDGDGGNNASWSFMRSWWQPTTTLGGSMLECSFGVETHHFSHISNRHIYTRGKKKTTNLGNYQEVLKN